MASKSHIIKGWDVHNREYLGSMPNGAQKLFKEHITYCGRLGSKVQSQYAYKATCDVCRRNYANLQ